MYVYSYYICIDLWKNFKNEFSFASFELCICVCVKVWFVKQFAVIVIIQNFTPYIITMQNGIWMAMTMQCVIEDQNSKFDINKYI